jgi:hypothetical protein
VDSRGHALNYDSGSVKEDWQLLAGSSGIFNSKKITVDDDDRIEEIIEYSTGAAVGAFARKTVYSYTDDNKNPDQIVEMPYLLEEGDLVTP